MSAVASLPLEAAVEFNPAPFLVIAVVFGVVAYLVSRNYRDRHGVTPWNLPSWLWGIIGFISLLLWAILIIIAVNTTKKPDVPQQTAWQGQPPYPAYPAYPSGGHPPGATPTAGPSTGPPPYPVAAPSPPPGWYPDPSGRHQSRYWDGTAWTEHVGDGASTSIDPV